MRRMRSSLFPAFEPPRSEPSSLMAAIFTRLWVVLERGSWDTWKRVYSEQKEIAVKEEKRRSRSREEELHI